MLLSDTLLKCAGCFQLLRTKNSLWALSITADMTKHRPHMAISCYLMFPAPGQTKYIKHEICLLKNCCPKWAVCDGLEGHPHLGQSHEHVCHSDRSQSHHCWTPPQTSSEHLCNHSLGEYQASAEYQLSRKAPQMPCPAFNPDLMAKRPGTVWLSFQFMSQDHCMYGRAVCGFESKHTMPCPPSPAIMDL